MRLCRPIVAAPLLVFVGTLLVPSTPRAAVLSADRPLYLDTAQPVEKRVEDLIGRLTIEEKIGQLMNAAPAIPRLGVPEYDWWNECLHGVARNGIATVFPQAIGMAATWNVDLIREEADVISTEARAKHHEAVRRGDRAIYTGLTMWSPNINILRDPRWGRGQETYGEDPYLTARLGVAFVQGLQGDDPRYLKVVSTPKHFAVHSGPEPLRHTFDAQASMRDLRETYLPAFEATVREAGAHSVMCAYNRYLGQPACAQETLLGRILRKEWGFAGYVVSDCGAITDIWRGHGYRPTAPEAASVALRSGCDLECGDDYRSLGEAVRAGLVKETDLDVALARLFTARFKLGMFDPPESVPYARIPITANDTPEHRALALRVAQESIVLLKNAGGRCR
jgi:beta-glucosidase